MTISLLRRNFNFIILILVYGIAATSDISPVLAGKKVTALGTEATTVWAGSSVAVSVTINKAAPSKGGTVYLTSSNPAIGTVPDSVMVSPGNTSALFVVDTAPSPNDSLITISASYGNKTKRLTVIISGVTPPSISLSALTISPPSAPGGTSVQGIVSLTAPAPAGGAAVALTNGNPAVASMPTSVIVPAGAAQASFTIATGPVSTTTTVSLSAVFAGVKKSALLDLTADLATLSSVSLIPSSIAGGASAQGTVALSAPAGFAGAVVNLSSSNPAIATVPGSVTVPAGATSASFSVSTSAVSASTSVTISAAYGGSTRNAQLTVAPNAAGLSSLSLNPTSITGGSPSQGTVNLSGPAGTGGVSVVLASNSVAATVPATLVVPAGSTSASFTVNTSLVSGSTSVSLSATYGGATRTASLNVLPISVNLATLNLNPSVVVGGGSSQGTVALDGSAPGGGALVLLSSSKSGKASVQASVTVPAGATSAAFQIDSSAVSTVANVTITAVYGSTTRTAVLTVQPGTITGTLQSIFLSPAGVVGGDGSQATVTLSAAAPSGGAFVSVSSSSPAATVPSGLTVPAGSSSASFTVATGQVSSSTSVSISASYNGVTKSAALTVDPAASVLSSVTLNPTSVVGGNSSQGNVILTGPAPSGGSVVSLSSNNSAATVPISVNVPAGSSSATFTVTTSQVSGSTSASISASYSGVTRSSTLTIEAVPAALSTLALNPASVVGGNTSQGTVTLSSGAPAGGAVVSLSSNGAAATVPANVTVSAGASTATFNVNTSAVSSSTPITISAVYSGVTRTAALTVNPVPAAMSSIALNPTTVVGGNVSQGTVTLTAAAPTGGAVVSLSSNNSAATVSGSVVVSGGASTATFTVNTSAVSSSTPTTISAVYSGVTRTATLTIDPAPAALSSVALNPTSVVGGSTSQGTVTLSSSAPSGGAVISLSSNNAAATVPINVTVLAGNSTATFTVNTAAVSSSTPVTISAVYSGVTRTAALTIDPVPTALSTIVLNPTSVVGGNSSQGTVTLSSAAPSGGSVISLSSNNAAASVLTSVTVAAGSSTATFTVNTSAVSSSTPVTISGVYSGVTRTASLTVTPVPAALSSIALNPTTVVGGNSSQGTVTLTSAAPTGGAVVSLSSNNAAATVLTNVTVSAGSSTATFTVNTSAVSSSTPVTISGVYSGVTRTASLTVNPAPAALSSIALNPTSVVGGNSSQGTVTLTAAAPTGGAVVSLSSNNAAATVLTSATVSAGSSTATFTVNTSAVSSSTPVTISGVYSGVTRTASLTVNPAPAALSSIALNPTSVVGGNSSQGTVTLTAAAPTGGAVVSLSSNNAAATVLTSATVSAGSSTATFTVNTSAVSSSTPVTISGVYSGVTRTASLTVNPVPAALSSIALNPTSVVGGNSSQGTVTLTAAAPTGGAVVSLSSNNAAATVLASVTVAAGSSTATFTVNTSAVSSSTPVTISGVYSGVTRTASLTVNPVPAALSSIALNPTTVVGGNSSQGTVTLTAAAPTGGAVVSLSSNNAAATVLTSVTVSAGSSTATFTVNTSTVSSSTPVTISGVYSGVTRTASLTVNPIPAALSSIALNPTTVVGGNTSQGTVTMTATAPTGGAVVSLSSNNAAATVFTTVTVAAGSSTATFTVNTSAVSSSTPVTISGVFNSVTRSASLTVDPAPVTVVLSSLALNPTTIIGGTSSQATVTLTGPAPVGGALVSLSSAFPLIASTPTSVTVLQGSSSASFTVNSVLVTSPLLVTISATYGAVTRGVGLNVAIASGSGANFYVAANGSATGNGSITNPWNLQTAFNHPAAVRPGDTIWIRGGTHTGDFFCNLQGTSSSRITVRGFPGERPTIDGRILSGSGKYVTFRDFEIINSTLQPFPAPEEFGVDDHMTGCWWINLVIVGSQSNGIGTWADGPIPDQSIVYGNIIQYSGHWGSSPGSHGHGIYAQSNNPMSKLIKHNIIMDGFGYGIHARSGGGANLDNITLDGNVVARQANGDILFSESPSNKNQTIIKNCTYNDTDTGNKGDIQGSPNDLVTILDNYFATGVRLSYLPPNTVFRGNTVCNRSDLVHLMWRNGSISPANLDWDANTFRKTAGNFWFARSANDGGSFTTYDVNSWKSAFGRDLTSTFMPEGPMTGTKVFIFPNTYETGRANIVIYNWSLSSTVTVDLSTLLTPGDQFELRNAFNYYSDVALTGTYSGGTISVPMTGRSVRPNIGPEGSPPSSFPKFGIFVIRKTN